ncbi:MAG: glycosyl transferase [Candidatus Rokuibacteriota bacterium]|nr:MAG: glycosyl transferase [Candidatus Rokubacteria bacterium]
MMATLLEIPLLVAVTVFTGYLTVLTSAALVAGLRRKPTGAVPAPRHRFAVVIPAHNESRTLPALLGRLQEIAYPRELYEVVVVADHCTDSTATLARAGHARVIECTEGARGGKGLALGSAFAALLAENRHDAFVILDADSDPAPTLLAAFDRELQRGARALQGYCKIGNPHESWRTALMAADLALVHLLRPLGKQELGSSAGLQGNGACLTRAALRQVAWQTRSVAEDHEYHVRLVLAGVKVRFVPDAEVATVMEPTLEAAHGQELRWEGGRFEVARAHAPALLGAAVARRSWPCLDAALDLTIPPFALLGAGTAVMASLHTILWIVGGSGVPAVLWATLLLGQTFYVIAGCVLARVPARTYLALVLFAPRYALSKVAICARVARGGTPEWTPTVRRAT